jgi:LPS export ABC transporter protein LptC
MPVYSRNLLLFSILAAAALLTWVLARNTEQEAETVIDDRRSAPQGYYLKNAVLSETDDTGAILFRVQAERVEHESRESGFNLEEVRVEYGAETTVSWRLTAARGTMTPDGDQLDLQSVRVRAEAQPEADKEPEVLVFETRGLTVDLRARTAATSEQVRMRKGQCEFNARGLNVDLNRDSYEFPDVVATCRPSPVPVLAIALLVGAAVAQENSAGETYTFNCAPWTGNIETNKSTCQNLSITELDSFRLTATRATVNEGIVPTTIARTEWRLTEGVRLDFRTAVLTAESAVFRFDDSAMLQSFEMDGTPAELSDFIEGRATPIQLRAERIVYDQESGALAMPGQVEFLKNGADGDSARGCDLTYWLESKTYEFGNLVCPATVSLAPPAAEDSSEQSPAEP